MKKVLAILLSLMLLFTMLAACNSNSNNNDDSTPTPPAGDVNGIGGDDEEGDPHTFVAPNYVLPDKPADVTHPCDCGGGHSRKIIIGTFYDVYNDSTVSEPDPNASNPYTALLEFENIEYVMNKYNVCYEYKNMTWDGIRESIPTSVLNGTPDADVYIGDPQFLIPAILNGMGTAIEDMEGINPEYLDDVLGIGSVDIMESLKIPGQDKTYMFKGAEVFWDMYMLGYNRDMIQSKGLADPQDLWDAGEWTWEAFREHCRVLTDPIQDIYGYGGFWTNFVQHLCFSNDTHFAAGPQQSVDSPKTLEVLNFIYDLYQVDKSARPWDGSDWDPNNDWYREAKSGFWISASWINNQFLETLGDAPLPFDIGMVPFPIGPSGNAETMATVNGAAGNYFFIPRYIKDAGEVFNIIYDIENWYDGDTELRDEGIDELANRLISERNYDLYMEMLGRNGFDLFEMLGFSSSIGDMLLSVDSEYTPAQYAETYRQTYQNALDNYFG